MCRPLTSHTDDVLSLIPLSVSMEEKTIVNIPLPMKGRDSELTAFLLTVKTKSSPRTPK